MIHWLRLTPPRLIYDTEAVSDTLTTFAFVMMIRRCWSLADDNDAGDDDGSDADADNVKPLYATRDDDVNYYTVGMVVLML